MIALLFVSISLFLLQIVLTDPGFAESSFWFIPYKDPSISWDGLLVLLPSWAHPACFKSELIEKYLIAQQVVLLNCQFCFMLQLFKSISVRTWTFLLYTIVILENIFILWLKIVFDFFRVYVVYILTNKLWAT